MKFRASFLPRTVAEFSGNRGGRVNRTLHSCHGASLGFRLDNLFGGEGTPGMVTRMGEILHSA